MGYGYTAAIALLCATGVALSLYAIYIERSKHADETYQATCDVSEAIACSYVLTSNYSTGLGVVELLLGKEHFLNIPNSYGGLLWYPLMFALGQSTREHGTRRALPMSAPALSAHAFMSVVGPHLNGHGWAGGWHECRRGWCLSGPVSTCAFSVIVLITGLSAHASMTDVSVTSTSQARPIIHLSVLLSLLVCVMSAYLVYVLVWVLQKLCLVCMAVHTVNLLLFLVSILRWRALSSPRDVNTKKVQ